MPVSDRPEPAANLESRLGEVESKLGFAEDLLEELNRTVFRQQEQIDLLKEQLTRLYRQMQEMGNSEAGDPADEVPPHY
jgi:SlyX protein